MNIPRVAGRQPVLVHLEQGVKYAFCTCGASAIQPFCDGTHRGTEFQPIKFIAERTEDMWMCMCKQSRQGAACDGSHRELLPNEGGSDGGAAGQPEGLE